MADNSSNSQSKPASFGWWMLIALITNTALLLLVLAGAHFSFSVGWKRTINPFASLWLALAASDVLIFMARKQVGTLDYAKSFGAAIFLSMNLVGTAIGASAIWMGLVSRQDIVSWYAPWIMPGAAYMGWSAFKQIRSKQAST